MPGKDRTFDATGVFPNARENREFSKMRAVTLGVKFFRNKLPEFFKKNLGFIYILAFQGGRHHGGRGFGYGTAVTSEGNFFDDVLGVDAQINFQVVAAERIITFGFVGTGIEFDEITGALVVLENDLLI